MEAEHLIQINVYLNKDLQAVGMDINENTTPCPSDLELMENTAKLILKSIEANRGFAEHQDLVNKLDT
jgi:hypothetical protein